MAAMNHILILVIKTSSSFGYNFHILYLCIDEDTTHMYYIDT